MGWPIRPAILRIYLWNSTHETMMRKRWWDDIWWLHEGYTMSSYVFFRNVVTPREVEDQRGEGPRGRAARQDQRGQSGDSEGVGRQCGKDHGRASVLKKLCWNRRAYRRNLVEIWVVFAVFVVLRRFLFVLMWRKQSFDVIYVTLIHSVKLDVS